MKPLYLILFSFIVFSCKKDKTETCDCQFPFITDNQYSTFLAENNESYWYNEQCWKYLGPTKTLNDPIPSYPGTNPTEWVLCGNSQLNCNQFSTIQNWSPGTYYKGDKVKFNNKIFIAFTQGNPMPESINDDIWALLCDSI